MAHQISLQARQRQDTGKGAARTLRRQGMVPAVIYGHGRTAESLTVEAVALGRMLIGISAGSTIVEVSVEGQAPVKALIREIQRSTLRSSDILHVDLYEVRADEKITLAVPVHLVGIPDGVRNAGGVLDISLRELQIRVFPADIPERIDLDVTALTIGHSLFVRDVRLTKGDILNDADLPVCSVVAPRTEEVVAAPTEEAAAPTEPELIRRPKAEEGEGEGEAE